MYVEPFPTVPLIAMLPVVIILLLLTALVATESSGPTGSDDT